MKIDISQKTDDQKIALLFTAFFSYNIITLFVNTIVNFFIPNTPIDTVICGLVYAYFIVFAVGPIIRNTSFLNFLFAFFTIIIYISHAYIYPNNHEFIFEFLPDFILKTVPFFWVGCSIRDYKTVLEYFEKFSPIVIFVAFGFYLITIIFGIDVAEDNMSFAYYLLPFVIIRVHSLIAKTSLKNLLIFAIAFSTLILTGTRGPLICLSISLIAFIIIGQTKSSKKMFWIFVCVCGLIFLSSDAFEHTLRFLNNFLQNHNIENRIIEKLLNDDIFNSSGRDNILLVIRSSIEKHPIVGSGIFADRYLINSYAHNFLYELMLNFGVIIGGFLFALIIIMVLKALFSKTASKEFLTIAITIVSFIYVKLFLSGSYIMEPTFFLMLGILSSYQKEERISDESYEEIN